MGEDQTSSVEEALTEITVIVDRLNALGPGDPGRERLIARRDELRKTARDASNASRSEDILRYERDQAQRRLTEIEIRATERTRAEKRTFKWINDPGSEANRINQMLREQDEEEHDQLVIRIHDIEIQLGESDESHHP